MPGLTHPGAARHVPRWHAPVLSTGCMHRGVGKSRRELREDNSVATGGISTLPSNRQEIAASYWLGDRNEPARPAACRKAEETLRDQVNAQAFH